MTQIYVALPPWKPIADWLARLPQEPDSDEPERNATKAQVRKSYERTAKAIAYDIAMETREYEPPGIEDISQASESEIQDWWQEYRSDSR